MKNEWIVTKEPVYIFYIKLPKISEYECYECGHVKRYIEWVKKGIGLTGYKTKRRKKTSMDYMAEITSKYYEKQLKDWGEKELLFTGKNLKFSRYSGLDKNITTKGK